MIYAQYNYAGRTVLITGAASGIGRATARKFAAAGANVVLADVNEPGGNDTQEEISNLGGRAIFCRTDVSSMSDCRKLVEAAITRFERLDYSFNNAGIVGQLSSLGDMSEANWQTVLGANLSGVFNCVHAEAAAMQAAGGVIVNNASVMGIVGGVGAAAYCASKHGVVGLTRAAAMDYGQKSIRVNAICPGFVRTPMTSDGESFVQKTVQSAANKCALRRLAEPDEIADAVLWLCSSSASFVTGAAIAIDGGYTAI